MKKLPKKIYRFIRSRLRRASLLAGNSQRISSLLVVSKLISVFFIFAVLPIGSIETPRSSYQTAVKLDTQSSNLLSLNNSNINIQTGRSRADLQALGLSHDPEEIKILIQEVAPAYNLDWRLVYAIGYHESGNFNSSLARRNNNFFGRKASYGGYASWPTPEEAVRNQCEYLKTRYFDRGLNSLAAINRVYAEDISWKYAVESVMNSL
ncbi:MAG: glucosaminidase domain-containing protein [Patescibacteria group bacterium]